MSNNDIVFTLQESLKWFSVHLSLFLSFVTLLKLDLSFWSNAALQKIEQKRTEHVFETEVQHVLNR